jgi:ABC-2 type transport system permease protein
MTWAVVARKDFADARGSRSLWALSAVFLLLALLFAGLYAFVPEVRTDAATTGGLIGFLAAPVAIFVAVAALVVAYKSVAGESESGSGKLLLSLPHTRRSVVVGKLLGRTGVLALPVAVGLVAMLAVVFAGGIAFAPVEYLAFAGVTALFVLAYVGLYVGLSASTRSTARAATLSVLALVVLEFAWDLVPLAAWYVLAGFQVPPGLLAGGLAGAPDLVLFLVNLAPGSAYLNAVGGVVSGFSTTGPVYLSRPFSLLVLALWAVVPVALGAARYARADL